MRRFLDWQRTARMLTSAAVRTDHPACLDATTEGPSLRFLSYMVSRGLLFCLLILVTPVILSVMLVMSDVTKKQTSPFSNSIEPLKITWPFESFGVSLFKRPFVTVLVKGIDRVAIKIKSDFIRRDLLPFICLPYAMIIWARIFLSRINSKVNVAA